MRGAYLKVRAMKERGKRILGIAIVLVITFAALHTGGHFAFYGTGISGLGEKGVSGFAVGSTNIEQLREQTKDFSSLSRILIIGEWFLLVLLILASLIGSKLSIKKQHVMLVIKKSKDKSKTDIDILYDLLKEKKKLALSSISETFKVKEETALEWAKILETADLAMINYPRFGEPELKIKAIL